MRRISSGLSIALIVSLVFGTARPQAQQSPNIPLSFTGMSANQQVEFALNAAGIGKTGTASANPQGVATSVFDFANQPKPEVEVDVYTFTCPEPPSPPKVVVKMVERGSPAPDDPCGNRRLIGFFWLHRARSIVINVATGAMDVNTGTNVMRWVLIGGAAVLVGTIAAVAGGDSSTGTGTTPPTTTSPPQTSAPTTAPPTTAPPTTAPPTTAPPTTSQTPFSALNGTYAKSASRQSNNCNFFVGSFTGTMTISGVNDTTGVGTLVERHPSQTFTYTVTITRSGSGFNFQTNSITSNIGGTNFLSDIQGAFPSVNSGTGTERFTRTTTPLCADTFSETYTRTGA